MTVLTALRTVLTLVILQRVLCDVISGKYVVTTVTTDQYGFPLDVFYISGVKRCFMECQLQFDCQSVVYDEATNVCKTNKRAVLPASLVTASPYQYLYIGKVAQTLTTMKLNCVLNIECMDTNSQCRDGVCKCFHGYSYDPTNHRCVTSCSAYGDTFQVEISRYIGGYNQEVVQHTTDSHCRTRCLQATGYVCRTYEFDVSDDSCYIQTLTATMVSPSVDSDYTLYTRDCY